MVTGKIGSASCLACVHRRNEKNEEILFENQIKIYDLKTLIKEMSLHIFLPSYPCFFTPSYCYVTIPAPTYTVVCQPNSSLHKKAQRAVEAAMAVQAVQSHQRAVQVIFSF